MVAVAVALGVVVGVGVAAGGHDALDPGVAVVVGPAGAVVVAGEDAVAVRGVGAVTLLVRQEVAMIPPWLWGPCSRSRSKLWSWVQAKAGDWPQPWSWSRPWLRSRSGRWVWSCSMARRSP